MPALARAAPLVGLAEMVKAMRAMGKLANNMSVTVLPATRLKGTLTAAGASSNVPVRPPLPDGVL